MAFVTLFAGAAAAGLMWWKRSNDRADEIYQWLASTDYIRKRDHVNEESRHSMDAILVHLRSGNQYAAMDIYKNLCGQISETTYRQSELVQRFKIEFPREIVPYELAKTIFLPKFPATIEVGPTASEVGLMSVAAANASIIADAPMSVRAQPPFESQRLHMSGNYLNQPEPAARYGVSNAPSRAEPQGSAGGVQPDARPTGDPRHGMTGGKPRSRRRSMSPPPARRSARAMGDTVDIFDHRVRYRSRSPIRGTQADGPSRSNTTAVDPKRHTRNAIDIANVDSDRWSEWSGFTQWSRRPMTASSDSNDRSLADDVSRSLTFNSDSQSVESVVPPASQEPDDTLTRIERYVGGLRKTEVLGYVTPLQITARECQISVERMIRDVMRLPVKRKVIMYYSGRPRLTHDSAHIARHISDERADGGSDRPYRPHRWFSAMIMATGDEQEEECLHCRKMNKEGKVMTWGPKCTKTNVNGLDRCANCEWHRDKGCHSQ
ncbi:hypothetical protein INS49_011982 [Diaporthe citri]|uniref:uncharacterized protein n=1 Tax=Diaporthe citri TaxID=83186 RepID=UPI001C826F31|nr:uncharacterized protein INS49_011982 [Diaporthe citri]KAG6360914.1 hypothetical protein INS49_011982 [Diaporthe citri]